MQQKTKGLTDGVIEAIRKIVGRKDLLEALRRMSKDNFTEKDLKISNLLKNYALKNFHIHEIGWRECLTIKEIVEFLEKHNQTFGTYYL